MNINESSFSNSYPLTNKLPETKNDSASENGKFPIPTEKYKGSEENHHWVKGADLSTYKKVCGSIGAASGAFSSHIILPAAISSAGFLAGEAVGSLIAGPIGGTIGKIAGCLFGLYSGAKLQAKTLIGREAGGRIGGVAGEVMGLFARALKIPLRSDLIEMTKNYSYDKMKTHLSQTTYTSNPRIDEKSADEFIKKLKPGDLVLTNDEACTTFSLIIVAADGKADFNHALLYAGEGKTIESRTVTHGVAEGVLKDVLSHKHHAIAIRPHYQPQDKQAQDVVQAGKDMIGTKYDYLFGMGDDSMYCSEMVFKAVKKGAPEIEFRKRPLITKEVILPGDLLRTSQADVVAEVGKDNTLFKSYLAKFV